MKHSDLSPLPPLTPEAFQAQTGVSDAVMARLEIYEALLEKWQPRINLVGKGTLADPWRRHMLDSAQVAPLIPSDAGVLVDLGSGAGFPGLVLAAMTDLEAHLVDSDMRKGVFLREAARAMGISVTVHTSRIEKMEPFPADVVSGRALAPLDKLLGYAQPFRKAGTTYLFLKGKTTQDELTAARKKWRMSATCTASVTDPSGVLVSITDLAPLE